MDWNKIEPNNLPKYNPYKFRLARLSRGMIMKDVDGIGQSVLSMIELGIKEPTRRQVELLVKTYGYPESFFEEWVKTETKWDDCGMPRREDINYYNYPIFLAKNPYPLSVASK